MSGSGWMTHREAAELLGVHVSVIPKMLRRGELTSRRERPALLRADVDEVAAARESAAAERGRRREEPRPRGPQPPDDEHEWLTRSMAAAVLGCSKEALGMRASRGQVPYTLHRGRRWYRLDLLELLLRARAAKRTMDV